MYEKKVQNLSTVMLESGATAAQAFTESGAQGTAQETLGQNFTF